MLNVFMMNYLQMFYSSEFYCISLCT